MQLETKNQTQLPFAIDLHADTLQRVLDEGIDLGPRSQHGHVDIPRMREGGLGAIFFSIWVQPLAFPGTRAVDRSWQLINALKAQILRHPRDLALATSAADIARIRSTGRIAALMGIEGGHSINGRIDLLEAFFRAGVRYMTLSWSNSNEICGSSGDEGRTRGLSEFGREVVQLMNRLGMMVDISHVSDRAFYDVLELSSRPVICSHSNLRKLCSHPRNLTDEMMRALAQQGGVCCMNYYPLFLADSPQGVSYCKVVDHIEAAVEVAGIDHVGLGSDFDGIPSVPIGLEDISKLPVLAEELARRNFDAASIEKIFSGNVMRVFAAATPAPQGV